MKKILNLSHLKIITLLIMIIDHIGASVFWKNHNELLLSFFRLIIPSLTAEHLYSILRITGRIGWPIFCFFIIEGVKHTRNRESYFFRTFLFACISQLPYNVAFTGSFSVFKSPNILFTISFGMIMLFIFEDIKETKENDLYLSGVFLLIAIIFGLMAQLLNLDYGIMGILMMFIFYVFYDMKIFYPVVSLFYDFPERGIAVIFSTILLNLYNGEKGKMNKWIFYIFYPLHLLLLGTI